eukprot:TRINITY_DN7105_c0_g1_i1.p1 TRINITY_DN7105_c0_g1~~TRINITY_DN7105_c0_g1_i1.p1  ORF type:complete len:384 (+),score=28.77 TRINITY_DN7105_c0_g1_i1:55-1152(+)
MKPNGPRKLSLLFKKVGILPEEGDMIRAVFSTVEEVKGAGVEGMVARGIPEEVARKVAGEVERTLFYCADCRMVLNSAYQCKIHLEGLRHRNQQLALIKKARSEGRHFEPSGIQEITEEFIPEGPRPRKPRGRRVRDHQHQPQQAQCEHEHHSCLVPGCYLRKLVHEVHCGCSSQAITEIIETLSHPEGGELVAEAIVDTLHCCGDDIIASIVGLVENVRDMAGEAECDDLLMRLLFHLSNHVNCSPTHHDDDVHCPEEYEMMELHNARSEFRASTCLNLCVTLVSHSLVPEDCLYSQIHSNLTQHCPPCRKQLARACKLIHVVTEPPLQFLSLLKEERAKPLPASLRKLLTETIAMYGSMHGAM